MRTPKPQMSAGLFEEFRRRKPALPQQSSYVFVPVSPPVPDLYFLGQATEGGPDDELNYASPTAQTIRCTYGRSFGIRGFSGNATTPAPRLPI